MILEGIVTTINAHGVTNVAPMGPLVDESMSTLLLRPFKTSTTYTNLRRHPQGVLHVTDDVLLLATSAVGRLNELPPLQPAEVVDGNVLSDACRWYEFEIVEFDDADDRTRLLANVVNTGRLRDFFGFNRAKHAVIEMAILATRLHILNRIQVLEEFDRLSEIVHKTAGPQELAAHELLQSHVKQFMAETACAE